MKKFLTVIACMAAIVLTAALVLPVALQGRIDRLVGQEIAVRLDARLEVGKARVSFLRHFPRPSIELRTLHLIGKGVFEGDTILSADRVSVVVSPLSLFGGVVEVVKASVVRPVMRAHKLSSGAENWNVVKPVSASTGPDEASPLHFDLRTLRVTNAVLHYENDSTRVRFSASPVNIRLRGELASSKSNMLLKVDAQSINLVSGNASLISNADAMLDAEVDADVAKRRFAFLRNTLRLNAIGMSLDGWFDLSVPGVAAMDIRADCSKVQFKELLSMVPALYARDFNNLLASGDMTLSAWVKGQAHDSHLPAFEIQLGVQNGRFQYSSLPKAVTDIRIAARVASRGGTLDNAVLELSKFEATVAGNPIQASLSVSTPLSDLCFDTSVSGLLDLSTLHKVYPLASENDLKGRITADLHIAGRLSDIDSQHYEKVEATGSFVVERMKVRLRGVPDVEIQRAAATISPASMTLGELGLRVGNSDLAVNGQLSGYVGYLLHDGPLSGRLYVHSDGLDLNEFMAAIPPAKNSGSVDTLVSVLVVPHNLSLQLLADVGTIHLGKMVFSDFTGEVQTDGGSAMLSRVSMKAFGGTMLASGRYTTFSNGQRPDLTLALDIVHASFARTFEEFELVSRLAPIFRKTEGAYSMTLDLHSELDAAMSPLLETLSAQGEIRASDIRVRDVATFTELATVLHTPRLRTIMAHNVVIRFAVDKGRIVTQPFDLLMDGGMKIALAGVTEPGGAIDYQTRVSLPSSGADSALTTMDARIGGTFASPKILLGAGK